jgi:thiamine biosynthesis protein ThiI
VKSNLIIVRYGEIGLKADYTRKQFENILIKNIKNVLKNKNISFDIKKTRGRLYVYSDRIETSCNVLKKIFGIISVSPAVKTKSNIESMEKLAIDFSNENIVKNSSFALRVKREGTHDYTSQDIAIKLGDVIVKHTNAKVNLTKPDFTLYIEIRDDNAYFYTEKIRGVGGLPLGSQGNVLALIDKPVSLLAAWFLMRRGCKTTFAIMNSSLNKKIRTFTKNWYIDSSIIRIDDMKMLKEAALKNNCNSIVTGHTIKENELKDIKKIKSITEMPVLTPIISFDNKMIQEKTKEIGLKI